MTRSHTDWLNRKVSHPIPHFQLNWIESWEGRISCNSIIWNFFSEMQLDQFIGQQWCYAINNNKGKEVVYLYIWWKDKQSGTGPTGTDLGLIGWLLFREMGGQKFYVVIFDVMWFSFTWFINCVPVFQFLDKVDLILIMSLRRIFVQSSTICSFRFPLSLKSTHPVYRPIQCQYTDLWPPNVWSHLPNCPDVKHF